MTLLDALMIAAALCFMEARNCAKREKIWDAINEIDQRKLDAEP